MTIRSYRYMAENKLSFLKDGLDKGLLYSRLVNISRWGPKKTVEYHITMYKMLMFRNVNLHTFNSPIAAYKRHALQKTRWGGYPTFKREPLKNFDEVFNLISDKELKKLILFRIAQFAF